ncbi:M64 family metallopeptidase [Pelagicoccus sp. SDUM812005]|uniref:M64 family metallopeptidase n=1 Tax=Pelagicoccus sp. SDUM812005 TaxID=3041257 RepID=UPI00280D6B5D|nr:M64 family metallopeptidase [Pelagicoccus sp. SDUM812005]MDQ8182075.1 M64 family metallopeptidase [Pelagicoccus sp. SDUM812005]
MACSLEGAVWQATLRFGEGERWELLALERAPDAKPGSVTSGGHATRFAWSWLGEDGATLQESEIFLPLQVSVPIAVAGEERQGWVLPQETTVTARVVGPESQSGIGGVRLESGEASALGAGWGESVELELPEERVSLFASDGTGPVGSYLLRSTGEDSQRFVMVILGDGYLREDIDSGLYRDHAKRTLAAFAEVEPWGVLLQGTNVHVVEVASAERGASREDGANGTIKDTYFQTAFYQGGIERLLYPQGDGIALARQAADDAVGVGAWDQIVMMVNSTKYGGSGGSVAVHSMNVRGPRVSVHEVGHSYAGLADEYDYGNGESWLGARPREVNVDTDLENLKWAVWLDGGVPLPTPDSLEWQGRVGAFEGARYKEFGVYRPERNCMMRELDYPFCRVCVERHLQRYFELLPFSDTASPFDPEGTKLVDRLRFKVEMPAIEGVTLQWYLDGQAIEGATEAWWELGRADLVDGAGELRVEIRYDESKVRSELANGEFSWSVSLFELPIAWLEEHGLPTDDRSGMVDHDGDGVSTVEEYIAGTDPVDESSRLGLIRLRSNEAGEVWRLIWWVKPGRAYRLERSEDLSAWHTVASEANGKAGSSVEWLGSYPVKKGDGDGFFRLKVELLE